MVDNGVAKVVVEFLKVRDQRTGTATELVPNTSATALAKQFMHICRFSFVLDFFLYMCSFFVYTCPLLNNLQASFCFAASLNLLWGYGHLSTFSRL